MSVKRLEVRGEGEGGGGERVYAVGVSVRAGRGRYRRTNIVTLAPRYQLHNNTTRTLQFAQACAATTLVRARQPTVQYIQVSNLDPRVTSKKP